MRTEIRGDKRGKDATLDGLRPDNGDWEECLSGWIEPFRLGSPCAWMSLPSLSDLLPWVAPGSQPGRTWVYAPEQKTLQQRWKALVQAPQEEKSHLFKETHATGAFVDKSLIPGMSVHSGIVATEVNISPAFRIIMHRLFDRKWVISDARVHHRPSPPLWLTNSRNQIFIVEQHAHPILAGPALLFSSLIPDKDCHSGRGGRVVPLFRDEAGTVPNIASRLLGLLAHRLGCEVEPIDLVAYPAAVTAHPGYTKRFSSELATPGIRIPLTGDGSTWRDAVHIGREVLWLHTFGERCADSAAGRPAGPPRMAADAPKVRTSIPHTAASMPETMTYDTATRTLHVGGGEIAPVAPEVVNYEVSGTVVLKHWFGYRRKKPAGTRSSPLNDIIATTWKSEMTTELLNVLHILGRCVALEPEQEALLDRIMAGPLITIDDLTAAAVLPIPPAARKPPKPSTEDLFSTE